MRPNRKPTDFWAVCWPHLGSVMKNNILIFFTFLSLAATQALAINNLPDSSVPETEQKIVKTYNSLWPAYLRIQLDDSLHGFIESKTCIFCKTIKVNITPNTKAYNNNVKVPLEQAKGRRGQFATVIYELKTNNVSAIRWWSFNIEARCFKPHM